MAVLEASGLRKQYGRRGVVALDGLDLEVASGGVFGFLGPNGAGKTTTIRCLLGLAAPTAGTCRILGADPSRDFAAVQRRVGCMIESQTLFPAFSARRNLRLLAAMYGLGTARVDEVLDQVGLAERAGDPVRTYSQGMRQRAGLAAALLKDPELLVLDEPANGLDPAGIKDVRELLRRLGAEGRTVFVSSHLLAEVQQTCDRVAILARGRCITSGPVNDVLSQAGPGGVLVRLASPAETGAALDALHAAGFAVRLEADAIWIEVAADQSPRVAEALAQARVFPAELRPVTSTLEAAFLHLTEEELL